MATCSYCKKKLDGLPHTCRYCGKIHCSNHLLPESHNCIGLKEYSSKNVERWKKNISEVLSNKNQDSSEEEYNESQKISPQRYSPKRKQEPSNPLKDFFSDKFYHLKKWLLKREHWEYDFNKRKKYLIKAGLILVLSILGLFFFYSKADQFNQVSLWIFNLGGILILVFLFFAIKSGWDLLKESHNLYKRQRKWIKLIVILILLILIWQGFSNGKILVEKVKTSYSQIEFSLLSPFSLSKSPGFSGQEVSLPSFFSKNSCSEIEQHAKNQYLNSAKYKKNFCGAICGQQNLEYQRYSCDKEDKFHCFCKQIKK